MEGGGHLYSCSMCNVRWREMSEFYSGKANGGTSARTLFTLGRLESGRRGRPMKQTRSVPSASHLEMRSITSTPWATLLSGGAHLTLGAVVCVSVSMCALGPVGTPTSHVSAWGGWLPAGLGACSPWSSGDGTICCWGPVGGHLLLCLGGRIVAVHRMFGLLVCSVLRGSVGMHYMCHSWPAASISGVGAPLSCHVCCLTTGWGQNLKKITSWRWEEPHSFHDWIKVALASPPFTMVILSCSDKQSVNYFPESPEVFVILIKSNSTSIYRTSMGSLAPAAVNIFNLPGTEEKLSSFHFASAWKKFSSFLPSTHNITGNTRISY